MSVRCPAGHPVPVVVSIARDPSLRARLFYRRLGPVEAVVVNGVRQMRSMTTQAPFPLLAVCGQQHQAIPTHVNEYAFSESTRRRITRCGSVDLDVSRGFWPEVSQFYHNLSNGRP